MKTTDRQAPSKVQKDNGKRKAGIHKSESSSSNSEKSYKPKMTVPVNFEEIIEMNEKALQIIAKRA